MLAALGLDPLVPLQLGPATVSGVLYAVRCDRLRGTSRAVPLWRQRCFYAGLVLIVATLTSPLGSVADDLFVAHMAEHLLLTDGGSLLLVLGLTGPLLAPLLRTRGLGWLRLLGHPGLAYVLWAVDLFAWHWPPLHQSAVRHAPVHALQHMLFIGLAGNMWFALFGPLPAPRWFGNAAKLGYIVAVRLTGAVLGNLLLFSGRPFYPVYAAGERRYGLSPLTDQTAAGATMMVEESILTILLLAWLFMKIAREAEERQDLVELAARRGVELTAERAARAVAAGRGAELRRRIEDPARPAPASG